MIQTFRFSMLKSFSETSPKLMPICKRCIFTNQFDSLKKDRKLFAQQLPDPVTSDLASDLNASKDWSIYCGIDPTAKSLHLGHLFPLMALFHLRKLGYPVITLIGGATSQIGDPSDKLSERDVSSKQELVDNSNHLTNQLIQLDNSFCESTDDSVSGVYGAMRIVNNMEWYESQELIPFISQYAREMHVNHMVSLKFVKDRLKKGSVLNLAEFFYQFLQAFDFCELYRRYNCRAQVGGADQWGNMVGGYELVKSIHDVRTLSLTTPLLLSGETKMGKSNPSSQIWLDPNLTSPYQMFQYLIQRTDAESPQMLKSLTLCDNEVIEQVINDNSVRAVQKKLAQEVTKFVHGQGGLAEAEFVTRILHQKKPSFNGVTEENVSMVLRSVEMVECHDGDSCMADVLNKLQYFTSTEVLPSVISSGAININGVKLINGSTNVKEVVHSKYSVLSIGKHYRAVLIADL